ncbi:hypothetical protein GALL_453430 [mine drainage metagenome]|uniref:Uncharacterized protein n=1 Tax=mine drainage metagenome TaxID=410659 RepID=A0A1J5PN80_9ZZZZ
MRGTDTGTTDLSQRLLQIFGTGSFALCQVGLHTQSRQWGFELMRSIGQKAFLRRNRLGQAVQQVVNRINQRRDFDRCGLGINGTEIIGFTGTDALFELMQRFDRLHQRQPHQQHRQRQDDKLRQHHALDNFGGQHRTFFERFGNLNQCRLGAGAGQTHPDIRHLDIKALDHVIADAHLVKNDFFFDRGLGQSALTTEKFTMRSNHLVVHRVGVIGAQQRARRARQADFGMFLIDADELRHGACVVLQCPVKRFAGNVLRHQPGQHQTHRPQQQQRREHPVQNFAKQRALLALKSIHSAAVIGLGRNFFQAIAQAAHGGDANRAFFNFFAQAVDINLNGIVADLFTPFAQAFNQLVFAYQAPGAL